MPGQAEAVSARATTYGLHTDSAWVYSRTEEKRMTQQNTSFPSPKLCTEQRSGRAHGPWQTSGNGGGWVEEVPLFNGDAQESVCCCVRGVDGSLEMPVRGGPQIWRGVALKARHIWRHPERCTRQWGLFTDARPRMNLAAIGVSLSGCAITETNGH
jgi:hypothetical protein